MSLQYYGDILSEHIMEAPNGALICRDVPIGRTGTQFYMAQEIQATDLPPTERVTVVREDEDVFDNATLASFEGMPVTWGHPMVDVTSDNWSMYSKGHAQNVRRGTGENSDKIVADLFITDPILKDRVKNKAERDVSSGYKCRYIRQADGTFRQVAIRGNHIAVVPKGRAGPDVAIKDSEPEESKVKNQERRIPYMSKPSTNPIASIFRMATAGAKSVQTMDEQEALVQDAVEVVEAITQDAETVLEVAVPAVVDNDEKPSDSDFAELLKGIAAAMDSMKEIASAMDAMTAQMKDFMPVTETVEIDDEKPVEVVKEIKKVEEIRDDEREEELIDDKLEALTKEITGDCDVEVTDAETLITSDVRAAALAIINSVKPQIAAISNPTERVRVTDALVSSIESRLADDVNPMENIRKLTAAASSQAAMTKDSQSFDLDAHQSAYDSRNPHNKD